MISRLFAVPRHPRTALVGILIAAMAVLTLGGLPAAAFAAGSPVSNESDLTTALSTAGTDSTVSLGGTFSVLADTLPVERTVTLDLAGSTVYAKNIHLNPGVTLTVIDSSVPSVGVLQAFSNVAGLAGITTTGATLIVNGGAVNAAGGPSAVGIGGDTGGNGGTVIIGTDGTVMASAPGTVSALGAGVGGTSFGSFEINGNFHLQSLELTVPTGASITGTGTITSWNHITNNGTILPKITGNENVSGNNFWINLGANYPADTGSTSYHLYAPTFQAAGISFPVPDRGPLVSIRAWTSSEDGTGSTITDTTPLAGINGGYYYAQWQSSGITKIVVDYEGSPSAVPTGNTPLTADYAVGGQLWNITDLVTFTSDLTADSTDSGNYGASFYTEIIGPRTVTGTLTSNTTVKDPVDFTVVHGTDIGDIALAMTPKTVAVGGNSTAYLSASDFYGNDFGYNIIPAIPCDWCELTLSSSDPTDVIDQATGKITFTTLGKHTITAELNMGEGGTREASATVTVTPVPVAPQLKALAVTGVQSSPAPWWIGLFLILLGIGAVTVTRRRRA